MSYRLWYNTKKMLNYFLYYVMHLHSSVCEYRKILPNKNKKQTAIRISYLNVQGIGKFIHNLIGITFSL